MARKSSAVQSSASSVASVSGGDAPDLQALRRGERGALARAITLLESTRAGDRKRAEALLQGAMPHTGNSIRVAISGAPGVGKSTFIEAFGMYVAESGRRVAVLTVDPSSAFSGGSILGDKTRMPNLANHPRAFVRSSPAGEMLGGVARRTQEAILACEAANFDFIIVETVGVGQSEVLAASMTDVFLLLLSPAGGDELQGIKRGIMELADIVVVNKADGDMRAAAGVALAEIKNALNLMQARCAGWRAAAVLVSAREGRGLDEVARQVDAYRAVVEADGALQAKRRQQAEEWLWNEARQQLLARLQADDAVGEALQGVLQEVGEGGLPASMAAERLVAIFMREEEAAAV